MLVSQYFREISKIFESRKVAHLGFTLAEVLVTLAIIGVVAAMTVPTLMQNYQRKSYVTQLHKVYSEILQASSLYLTERNAVNLKEAGLNSQDAANNFVATYFKIVQTCENSLSPCFSDSYNYINGSSVNLSDNSMKAADSFVLASGASVRPLSSFNSAAIEQTPIIGFFVDINGGNGPNIIGRDAFFMALYNNGIIDTTNITDKSAVPPYTVEQRKTADANWKPFADILNDNWEMTY